MKREQAIQQTQEQYGEIIYPFHRIPPQEWLMRCNTDDQRNHFLKIQIEFGLIKIYLCRFFSGIPEFQLNQITLDTEEFINSSGKFSKRFIQAAEARAVVYRAYYTVIFDGWHYLKPILDSRLKGDAPNTPGETISSIIQDDCKKAFMPCKMAYFEVENRKVYEAILHYKALLKSYREAKPIEVKKERLNKALKRLKSKSKSLEEITKLDQICQEFIKIGSSLGKKDTVLKSSIQDYWNRVNDYINIASHKAGGFVWINGQIQPMSERGGIVSAVKEM